MTVTTPKWWASWLEVIEQLWPEPWRGPMARCYVLAIGLQESAFARRRQWPRGPARSYWQIEPPTIDLLLRHVRIGPILIDIAGALDIEDYYAIEYADAWAASLARGLLRAVPGQLVDDEQEAWRIYLQAWRPGQPRPETWPHAWRLAREATRCEPSPSP